MKCWNMDDIVKLLLAHSEIKYNAHLHFPEIHIENHKLSLSHSSSFFPLLFIDESFFIILFGK